MFRYFRAFTVVCKVLPSALGSAVAELTVVRGISRDPSHGHGQSRPHVTPACAQVEAEAKAGVNATDTDDLSMASETKACAFWTVRRRCSGCVRSRELP